MTMTRRDEAGLTLIEVTFVVITLTIGFAALTQSMASSSAARYRLERQALALSSTQDMIEVVRATAIDDLAATFGPEGEFGDTFSVPGLDGDEPAGRIILVTDETVQDADLGLRLGMPRDLDGDDMADNMDVSATALAIPVIVEVRWTLGANVEVLRMPLVILR